MPKPAASGAASAEAVKPAPATSSLAPEADVNAEQQDTLVVELERLPMRFHNWVLDYEVIPDSNRVQCLLRTDVTVMEDGAGGSKTYLLVTHAGVVAVTRSNIDLEYSGDGLQINLHPQRPIDSVQADTNAVFSRDAEGLLNEMREGGQARLTLGFWPTWPMSRTYSVRFDLGHFPLAWEAYRQCQQKA